MEFDHWTEGSVESQPELVLGRDPAAHSLAQVGRRSSSALTEGVRGSGKQKACRESGPTS